MICLYQDGAIAVLGPGDVHHDTPLTDTQASMMGSGILGLGSPVKVPGSPPGMPARHLPGSSPHLTTQQVSLDFRHLLSLLENVCGVCRFSLMALWMRVVHKNVMYFIKSVRDRTKLLDGKEAEFYYNFSDINDKKIQLL